MSGELIVGGLALLFLLGGKKKKKKEGKNGDGTHGGSELDDPKNKENGGGSEGGSQGGSGKGGKAPKNLAPDAVWVSPDCKEVVFGDGTGEAFWESKGRPTAQKFIEAYYTDPYEIAKLMITSMAPCVFEFPVRGDGYDPMEEEFLREMFNRNFKEVYYFVQFLHDKTADLMDMDDFIIEFDENCDVPFVGIEWDNLVSDTMVRFYLEYMYPVHSAPDHDKKHPTWPMADVGEKSMDWFDNVATAVVNRMHPECGIAIVNAFKKDPYSAQSFFAKRPGLHAMYKNLIDRVDWVDTHRDDALDFKRLDKLAD